MIPFEPIAHIENDYSGKFGIPRQSGLDGGSLSKVVFEKKYNDPSALKGIEGYSHLWLIWYFSEGAEQKWTPTVRPPRLGGNVRMGVFATRSPNRPNRIGLSCVQLDGVMKNPTGGCILLVRGADLMNGTPILDIKPYLPFCDSFPDATEGFAGPVKGKKLRVSDPDGLLTQLDEEAKAILVSLLSEDPRPSYHKDPERVYSFEWAGYKVRFTADLGELVLKELKKEQNV